MGTLDTSSSQAPWLNQQKHYQSQLGRSQDGIGDLGWVQRQNEMNELKAAQAEKQASRLNLRSKYIDAALEKFYDRREREEA